MIYDRSVEHIHNFMDYDIHIYDDVLEVYNGIKQKDKECKNPCRMLSGDVFPWLSMNDKSKIDINIGDFHAQWNKSKYFAVDPKSVDEVGCIHTSQGMEFEYVGLIIGDDLMYRNGHVVTDYTKHPAGSGEFKRPHKRKPNPDDADILDKIIRNTYKVLFTRGQKGLFLYVVDDELKKYIKTEIEKLHKDQIRYKKYLNGISEMQHQLKKK